MTPTCGHYTSAAGYCGAADGVRQYITGPRCPRHTPAALAGHPEPGGQYCAPSRCYCGDPACPAYESYGRPLAPITHTVVDERSVKSGRRASGERRRAQQAADTWEAA